MDDQPKPKILSERLQPYMIQGVVFLVADESHEKVKRQIDDPCHSEQGMIHEPSIGMVLRACDNRERARIERTLPHHRYVARSLVDPRIRYTLEWRADRRLHQIPL